MDKVYETEHTVQMHTHHCYELTYYADGTGATEVEGEKFRFISGTFILAAPNAPHTETHKDRVAVVCVGFDTSTPLPSRLFVDKDRRVADTLRIIGRELKEKKLYYPSALAPNAVAAFLRIVTCGSGAESPTAFNLSPSIAMSFFASVVPSAETAVFATLRSPAFAPAVVPIVAIIRSAQSKAILLNFLISFPPEKKFFMDFSIRKKV